MKYLLCFTLTFFCILNNSPVQSRSIDSAQYRVTLIVKNLPPQTIEVFALSKKTAFLGEYYVSKSTDTIVLQGKAHEEYAINFITEKNGSFLLPVYNEKVTILADFQGNPGTVKLHQNLKITGSLAMQDLQEIYQISRWYGPLLRKYNAKMDSLLAAKASDDRVEGVTLKLAQLHDRKNNVLIKLLKRTQSPMVGYRCILNLKNYVKSVPKIKLTQGELLGFYRYFITKHPHHILTQSVRNYLKRQSVEIHKLAPEVALPDTSMQTQRLSRFRGQYVLLDFWASWCKPCRKESPYLRQAFEQFSLKGFTIVSVSVDKKETAWKKAIRKDRLQAWMHLRENKGWQSKILATYGIQQLPTNFLIDPEGKIIAINLRKEKLLQRLNQLFAEKN